MFRARSIVLLVSVACAPACGTSPTAPVLEPASAAAFRDAGSVGAASTSGEFKTTPVADAAGFVRLTEGTTLKLNGSHLTGGPEGSVLRAEWGDGQRDRVPCGACRLEHSYTAGTYTLVATFGNGAEDVTKTFTVEVAPVAEKISCSVVQKADGSALWIAFSPVLQVKAGDTITATMSGGGQYKDIYLFVDGIGQSAVQQNGNNYFPGDVEFKRVAAADGVTNAHFWDFMLMTGFNWSLQVERCAGDN